MRHDPKVTCDLCQSEIDTDLPFSAIRVPIPPHVKEEIEKDALQFAPARIIGQMIVANIPSHYSLDVCNGCIDGLFPTIKHMVADQIREYLAKRKKAAEARKAKNVPDDPDDDD